MRTSTKAATVALLGVALTLGSQAPSSADPKRGDAVNLTCGSTVYAVHVAPGNGDWTPALVDAGHQVLIPHAFGPFTGTVYDDKGVQVDTFTDPASVQGSGKQKNDVSCSFTFNEVSDGSDPEFPAGYRFTGTGSVTGQIAGRR